ncbi:hypothetical protein CBLAS_1455 [Campylobacter blaseri]|uniref:PIN domain-containing protein n=1 Tax=Campylobacter blaseri TaxID=2042961 RepID=A0A2P8QZ64_9BACT|nr:hypothetical protein [Campylobacter blaseri]PSM51532.1 hypothetical protein CQ405_06965 [Campylobacter blaseri]PSM53325.1 hypothetical protein CRN67_06970 [Campylobacter blaseri]QKF86619.1 hypothetical protein CBLAS_1455 [Campylobacter blaseri]
MQYVYLDWNIIQNLKNIPKTNEEKICELFKTIKKLKGKYKFPFSEAHILDLLNSCDSYHKEDLDFLFKISKGFEICIQNDEMFMQKFDIKTRYESIKKIQTRRV